MILQSILLLLAATPILAEMKVSLLPYMFASSISSNGDNPVSAQIRESDKIGQKIIDVAGGVIAAVRCRTAPVGTPTLMRLKQDTKLTWTLGIENTFDANVKRSCTAHLIDKNEDIVTLASSINGEDCPKIIYDPQTQGCERFPDVDPYLAANNRTICKSVWTFEPKNLKECENCVLRWSMNYDFVDNVNSMFRFTFENCADVSIKIEQGSNHTDLASPAGPSSTSATTSSVYTVSTSTQTESISSIATISQTPPSFTPPVGSSSNPQNTIEQPSSSPNVSATLIIAAQPQVSTKSRSLTVMPSTPSTTRNLERIMDDSSLVNSEESTSNKIEADTSPSRVPQKPTLMKPPKEASSASTRKGSLAKCQAKKSKPTAYIAKKIQALLNRLAELTKDEK